MMPGVSLQVNPAKAPQVVGGLLDAEAPDDFVNNLILSVRSLIPVEGLCAEVRPPLGTVPASFYVHAREPCYFDACTAMILLHEVLCSFSS
jgi:hypothetical protein